MRALAFGAALLVCTLCFSPVFAYWQPKDAAQKVALLFPFVFVFKWIFKFFLKKFSPPVAPWQDESFPIEKLGEFVIVLRPFKMDQALDAYDHDVYSPLEFLALKYYTLEEQLTNPFKEANLSVIGFSHPGKHSIYLGYKRFAIDNAKWEDLVLRLIDESKFICCYGYADKGGFDKELQYILDDKYKSKLIIYYPGTKAAFAAFLNHYNRYCSFDGLKFTQKLNDKTFGGIIYYDAGSFIDYPFKNPSFFQSKRLFIWSKTKEFLSHVKALPDVALKPAGFLYSLWATLIDVAIIVLIAILIFRHDLLTVEFEVTMSAIVILTVIFLAKTISVGKILLGIEVRDKSGCPPQAGQIMVRQGLRFLTLSLIVVYGVYLVFALVYFWRTKKIYLVHEELSMTRKFRVVKPA